MKISMLAVAFILAGTSLVAVPVQWQLVGVTFGDTGTAAGSFVYDADTNQYSSVNVVTTVGDDYDGGNYISYDTNFHDAFVVKFLTMTSGNLTGTPSFTLEFDSALTNAGGTIVIDFGTEGNCLNADCSASFGARNVNAGSVMSVTTAPEPVSFLSAAIGLAALAGLRLRRTTP